MKKIISFSARKSSSKFEELLEPHINYLYRLAYRFCTNQEDAEDLVQDLLIKLFPRRDELEVIEKLRPWLVTSLYRMFIDSTRKSARTPLELIDDEIAFFDTRQNGEAMPDEILEEDQRIDRMQSAFNSLSEDHRVLLTLHDIEGYPLVELETMLGVPAGTLKSRMHRARARMRDLLRLDIEIQQNQQKRIEING